MATEEGGKRIERSGLGPHRNALQEHTGLRFTQFKLAPQKQMFGSLAEFRIGLTSSPFSLSSKAALMGNPQTSLSPPPASSITPQVVPSLTDFTFPGPVAGELGSLEPGTCFPDGDAQVPDASTDLWCEAQPIPPCHCHIHCPHEGNRDKDP